MLAKLRPWIGAACIAAPIFALVVVAAGQAQPPGFPRMPGMPGGGFGGRMPGVPGMPGGGFGGMPEYVYTCSHCGKEVARSRSPFTPNYANCPFCGVRFGNTMAGGMASMHERMQEQMGGMGGGMNPPPTMPNNPNPNPNPNPNGPEANAPEDFNPNPPVNTPPAFTPPAFTPSPPLNPTPAPTTTTSTPAKSGAGAVLIWVLVGIIAMLIFVALLGGAIWLISTSPSLSSSSRPRRRRRRQPPIIHP